jgi:FixJ family two-component response regulator
MDEQVRSKSVVYVVDDDEGVREGLKSLFNSIGMKVEAFSTTADFLGSKIADEVSCLILDVRPRGQNGLDFQDELTKANLKIPIIFITGHGERLGITQQK